MKIFKGFIFFITLFALSRIVPHPPNFTPLIAGAIFLPYLLEDKRAVLMLPIVVLFITDLFLGFHGLMAWTYASFLLIGLLTLITFKINLTRILLISVISPTLFFILTNFGVWLGSDAYTQSVEGLITCYALGLPFYANSLLSTLLFSSSFFLIASLISKGFVSQKCEQ